MILVIPSTDRTKAIRIKKRDFINNKKGERENNRHEMSI